MTSISGVFEFDPAVPNRRSSNVARAATPPKRSFPPSGRNVLRGGPEWILPPDPDLVLHGIAPGTLSDLDTGAILWQAGPLEELDGQLGGDAFLVRERWHRLWERWFPGFKYETRACRSLETGELRFRLDPDTDFDPRRCNLDRTVIVMPDGAIHPYTLEPNLPLLAICQSILALPLVMLRAVLRWRRKRRLRLASVQP